MAKLNRAAVVATAIDILETGGATALTIPALALKLKIRPPSLYNHIESISDLKREISIYAIRLFCDTLKGACAGKTEDEAVLAVTTVYRRFAMEHPALYELSVMAPPASDREWSEAVSGYLQLWMDLFGTYGLDRLQTRHAVRAFRGMVHGFVNLEINGGWLEDIDLDMSFAASQQLLLQGLREARTKAAR